MPGPPRYSHAPQNTQKPPQHGSFIAVANKVTSCDPEFEVVSSVAGKAGLSQCCCNRGTALLHLISATSAPYKPICRRNHMLCLHEAHCRTRSADFWCQQLVLRCLLPVHPPVHQIDLSCISDHDQGVVGVLAGLRVLLPPAASQQHIVSIKYNMPRPNLM